MYTCTRTSREEFCSMASDMWFSAEYVCLCAYIEHVLHRKCSKHQTTRPLPLRTHSYVTFGRRYARERSIKPKLLRNTFWSNASKVYKHYNMSTSYVSEHWSLIVFCLRLKHESLATNRSESKDHLTMWTAWNANFGVWAYDGVCWEQNVLSVKQCIHGLFSYSKTWPLVTGTHLFLAVLFQG